jgi:transposase
MKPVAHLDRFNLDPDVKTQVAALIEKAWLEAFRHYAPKKLSFKTSVNFCVQKNPRLPTKIFKIEALTYELAYYKHIRFSTKSEAMTPL